MKRSACVSPVEVEVEVEKTQQLEIVDGVVNLWCNLPDDVLFYIFKSMQMCKPSDYGLFALVNKRWHDYIMNIYLKPMTLNYSTKDHQTTILRYMADKYIVVYVRLDNHRRLLAYYSFPGCVDVYAFKQEDFEFDPDDEELKRPNNDDDDVACDGGILQALMTDHSNYKAKLIHSQGFNGDETCINFTSSYHLHKVFKEGGLDWWYHMSSVDDVDFRTNTIQTLLKYLPIPCGIRP